MQDRALCLNNHLYQSHQHSNRHLLHCPYSPFSHTDRTCLWRADPSLRRWAAMTASGRHWALGIGHQSDVITSAITFRALGRLPQAR